MRYDETMEELQTKYPSMKVFSFMFYGQPGIRDMEILEMGVVNVISLGNDSIPHPMPLHILVEEINEEAARAYDENRGWLIRFVFPKMDYPLIDDDWWKEFLSDGLTELRVEHKFLFVETIGDDDVQ